MDSYETASAYDLFKSKKILRSSSKSSLSGSDESVKASDESPWSSKTPEKAPRRLRNRGAALSLKEVRQIAKKLQGPDPSTRPDPVVAPKEEQTSSPTNQTLFTKSKKSDSSAMLPEKFEVLDKFFSSLDSSIRLLRIKGTMSTFTNISRKIECLTDRRFSYGHLAQLKFILPEAIELEKVLIRDERTSCMKPDLHVTLNVNAIENGRKLKSDSGNLLLRKVFRARLLEFSKAHPEGDEVPEETLPEPFNQSKQELLTNTIKASTFSLTNLTSAFPAQQPASASHLSQSFRRAFSKNVSSHEIANTSQMPSMVPVQTPSLPVSEACVDQNPSEKSIISQKILPTSSRPPPTPVKKLDSAKFDISSSTSVSIHGTPAKSFLTPAKSFSTPAKSLSTPAKLMSATPSLKPPKRSYMSPDDDSTKSPAKLVRRPQRSRSLKFDTPVKNKHVDEASESENLLLDSDIFDLLPENLLQSIREKEKKALEDQDPAISQAKRRKQIIASLPKLFDMLHFFFQSVKRSTITKDELIHNIIASHLDIVDKREVEEQLRLLQELIPDYIYEKTAYTGDLLLCINRLSSPESLRARLADAK